MNVMRVLLVDDDAALRLGLRHLFEVKTSFEIVGEAENGAQAIDMVEKLRPDVVVMDVIMPLMDGVVATQLIKQKHPAIHVLALSASDDRSDVEAMVQAGASGYLLKSQASDQLIYSLRAIHPSGEPDPDVASRSSDALPVSEP